MSGLMGFGSAWLLCSPYTVRQGSCRVLLLMIYTSCITSRTLNYGKYGVFLIMALWVMQDLIINRLGSETEPQITPKRQQTLSNRKDDLKDTLNPKPYKP